MLVASSVTSPEDASGMQKAHLKVEVQECGSGAGKRRILRNRVRQKEGRKPKIPALRNPRTVHPRETPRPRSGILQLVQPCEGFPDQSGLWLRLDAHTRI